MLHCKLAKSIINNSRSHWFSKANTLVWAEPCARWAELKMLSFWAGGISSFPSCAREYRLLRRLKFAIFALRNVQTVIVFVANAHAHVSQTGIAHAQIVKMDFPCGFSPIPRKNNKIESQNEDQTMYY